MSFPTQHNTEEATNISSASSQSGLFLVIQYPMLFLNALVGIYIGLSYSYVMYRKYLDSSSSASLCFHAPLPTNNKDQSTTTRPILLISTAPTTTIAEETSKYTEQIYLLWSYAFASFAFMNVVSIPYHCIRFGQRMIGSYSPIQIFSNVSTFTQQTIMQKSLWGLDCYFTGMSSMAIIMASVCMMNLALLTGHQQPESTSRQQVLFDHHWYSIGILVFAVGFYSLFTAPSSTVLLECWYLLPTYAAIGFMVPAIAIMFYKEQQMLLEVKGWNMHSLLASTTPSTIHTFYRWLFLITGPLLFVCALYIDWLACSYFDQQQYTTQSGLPWYQVLLQDCFMVGTLGFFASNVSFYGIALFLQHYYNCGLHDYILQKIIVSKNVCTDFDSKDKINGSHILTTNTNKLYLRYQRSCPNTQDAAEQNSM